MDELNHKRLMLGMAHAVRSMQNPHGMQSGFSRVIQIFIQIEPLLNELKADGLVTIGEDAHISITEAGYAELHKTDFDQLYEALESQSLKKDALRDLIEAIKKKGLPETGMDVSSFEWTGTVYNTHPRQISEALWEALGGSSKIQMIEDQVLYNDKKWDIMVYPLVNAALDDTILPGHDDYRIKAIYLGGFRKFESFIKGFALALQRESKRYAFEYYEIDEEEDIVGEEYSLYSPT